MQANREQSKSRLKIYCVVPLCANTARNAPNKLFLSLPKNENMRIKWCKAMRRGGNNPKLSSVSSLHCCEDHFNLEEDLENYWQYKLMKNVNPRLKKGVVPHIYDCQKTCTSITEERSVFKRQKLYSIQQAVENVAQNLSRHQCQKPLPGTSKQSPCDDVYGLNINEPLLQHHLEELITDKLNDKGVQVNIKELITDKMNDRGIQVNIKPSYRSKSVNTKIRGVHKAI